MAGTERMTAGEYLKMMGINKPGATSVADAVARGQTAPGVMNKTETRYAELLDLRQRNGEVKWWKYEAIKLRLAEKAFITIDFFVMLASGDLECHEVKGGFIREDAALKLKFAASLYPFRFLLVQAKRHGGEFAITEVARGR